MVKSKRVRESDMTKNLDSTGKSHFISDRKLTGSEPEIGRRKPIRRLGKAENRPETNFDLIDEREKTDYKLLRYWSSSEEETESDESEGEPEEGALPTQLMGFASVKIDVSQTLFKKKETDHYHVDL